MGESGCGNTRRTEDIQGIKGKNLFFIIGLIFSLVVNLSFVVNLN